MQLITCPIVDGMTHKGTTPLRVVSSYKSVPTYPEDEVYLVEEVGDRYTFVEFNSAMDTLVRVWSWDEEEVHRVPETALGIDLTDPTGQAHVAWWAALRHGVSADVATSAVWWTTPSEIRLACARGVLSVWQAENGTVFTCAAAGIRAVVKHLIAQKEG